MSGLSPLVQAAPNDEEPRSPHTQRRNDPSGSRSGEAYLRRYEVITRLEVRSGSLRGRELQQQAVFALQRAAANTARLTFVDTNLNDSRRAIRDYERSGDFNTGLPDTPRRGHFIPATDRLELAVTVEYRTAPQNNRFRVGGTGARYASTIETVKIGLSGRVISIDTGAIAYALTPVWVEKKATRDKRIEADKRLTIKGIEIPFLPPLGRAGRESSNSSRKISLMQQGFDEAAAQLVTQLETAPLMRLDQAAMPQSGTAPLLVESFDVDGKTVYLSGTMAGRLRRGDEVLLPVVAERTGRGASRLVRKAIVTKVGELVEARLQNGSLRGLVVDESRPIRVLGVQ